MSQLNPMQIGTVCVSLALFILQVEEKTVRTLAVASIAVAPAVHVLKLIKLYFFLYEEDTKTSAKSQRQIVGALIYGAVVRRHL